MTDTTIKTEDLGTLLGSKIPDISSQLQYLDDGQLIVLHDLEAAGSNRSTLLAAIDAEIARRAQAASDQGGENSGTGAVEGSASGGADTGDGSTSNDGSAGVTDTSVSNGTVASSDDSAAGSATVTMTEAADAPKVYSQGELDAALADQAARFDRSWAELSAELDRAKAALGAASADAATVATSTTTPATSAARIVLVANAESPALVALSGVTHIVFTDAEDVPLPGLPTLGFNPVDYSPDGESVILSGAVEFPREAPRGEVLRAFLLDDEDDAVAMAELITPFGVGGGIQSRIPGGSLRFARA